MAGFEDDDKREFDEVLMGQIKSLRDQLDKDKDKLLQQSVPRVPSLGSPSSVTPHLSTGRFTHIDERSVGQDRVWDAAPGHVGRMPGALPPTPGPHGDAGARQRELRAMTFSSIPKHLLSMI